MTIKLDLVAIKKNEKIFVKAKDQYDSNFGRIKFRFDADELESFHKSWRVFSSVPTTVEQFVGGKRSVLKYRLKDGFTPTDKTPANMTKEAFRCCDDECENSEIRGLYEPVYRQEPDEWVFVKMDIELIDSNCEPLIDPKYKYFVRFPNYIDKHMIVQHKVPCFIKGKAAFGYIVKAVKANIPDYCFISSDYDFHFAVEMRIPNLHETPLINVTKKVIDISSGFHHGVPITDINADNYHELETKMDGILQEYIDRMNQEIVVCPNCNGRGWVEKEE